MKRKGISLIVLVITIVVIIILAAAVILSLGKNNPINSAKEAKVKTTIDNFKSDLVMSVSKITADSLGQVATTDIDAPGKYEITELIPSIKGTEYENELVVVDGKIQVKTNSSLSLEIQIEINNVLGQSINASVVKINPNAYYGKLVNFKDGQNFNNWQLFYADDTNIYLIAGDYIPVSMLPQNVFELGSYNPEYCVNSSVSRVDLLNKIINKENFNQFKDSEEKALEIVGAPTIEQFATVYNVIKHVSTKTQKIYYKRTQNLMSDGVYGFYVKSDVEPEIVNDAENNMAINLEYSFLNIQDTSKIGAYWLATPSARNTSGLNMVYSKNNNFQITHTPTYDSNKYGGDRIGLRPVVKLNNNVSLVDAGDGTFNLE